MRYILAMKKNLTFLLVAALSATAVAEEAESEAIVEIVQPSTLDELLKNIEDRRVVESKEHAARERRFAQDKANQAKMLKDAQAEKAREERRSDRLETTFEENEIRIGDMTEQLDKRLGSLRELFGVLQQVAGDTENKFYTSNVSAELPVLQSLDTVSINTFYDAANVWGVDYSSAIDDSNKIRSSAGLAANWYTPVGPLTFSFAHPITKASTDKTEGFRFNLGTSF